MIRFLSSSTRRKFLTAYENGVGTLEELAEDFRVSVGWAKKVSAAHTRTGLMLAAPGRMHAIQVVRTLLALDFWVHGSSILLKLHFEATIGIAGIGICLRY